MSSVAYLYSKPPSATELAFSSSTGAPMPSASRPGIRRKSSASNLLSSLRSTTNATTPAASGFTTPTTREWDAQSMYSEASNGASTMTTSTHVPPLPTSQSTSVDYLREVVRKRISTLQYLKGIHEGKSHWLATILITRTELERAFNTSIKKQRAYRYACLGMSLSSLFDIPSTNDFLKALLTLLQEYDSVPEDNVKPKMRNIFRTSKLPKKAGGSDFNAYTESGDASYLLSPNIPFQPDYFQVVLAFLDVLTEVYHKLSRILGPSPLQSSHAIGPAGFGIGAPSTSSMGLADGHSSDQMSPTGGMGMASILQTMAAPGVPNHLLQPQNYSGPPHFSVASPPPTWTPVYGDMLSKVDGKFMKIINSILKKLDEIARKRIQEELESLNPLLANLSPGDYDER